MNPEFMWNQNEYGRNEYPHPHPQGINEAIQREIEKERIREEIIISEIVRRRVLEAEVRRELMMEREMALLQGRDGFPFGSSPVMGLESQMRPSLLMTKAEGWSAEERLGMALNDKEKLKRSENGGLETLSFQRVTADVRISEIKPASEGNKEKERIILLTKPNGDVSGSRTKDVTPPEVVNIELLDDVIANKISKEEWSCALCQIMATSEKDLNEHVLGKKHKLKVAALRARRTGKDYSIGLLTKKPTKSIRMKEKGVKLIAETLFSYKGGKATSKKDELPLSEKPKSEHLKKIQAEVIQKEVKEQKNENDLRKKGSKFSEVSTHKLGNIEFPADVHAKKKCKEEWRCALCQVIATRENDLIEHVLGKKHNSKVAELRAQRTGDNHCNGLSPKKPTKSIHVEENGVKLKAQSLSSQKGGKATSKKDDLPLSENPKSEHLKKTQAELIWKEHENDPRKKGCKFSEVMNAHKLGNTELPADVTANKKSQEWRCALCQVIATSKNDLIEHVLGKKHNSKVAELRAQRTGDNHSIGLSPKIATKSFHVEEEGVKLKSQFLFSEKVWQGTSKKDDLPLLENPKSVHLDKTQAEVIREVQKNENDSGKKGCKFSEVMNAHKFGNVEPTTDISNNKSKEWSCALCEVTATSENGLREHVLGKKHNSKVAGLRAQRTGDNHSNGLSPKKATNSFHVEEEGVKLKSQLLFSEQAGQGTSKKDDLPLLENPKSVHLEKTQAEVIREVQKNENDSGKKGCQFSEVMNAHKFGNVEPAADISNNKSKEWGCALCEVTATSENGLREHVLGKKHNSKVAGLRAQRTGDNHSNGLSPKKPTNSFHVEEGVKLKSQILCSEKAGQGTSKKDDLPLLENPKSVHLEKTQAEVIREVQKNENDPVKIGCKSSKVVTAHKQGNIEIPADVITNEKSKEWSCALCQISASSEKGLNEHMHGKKHKSKEAALRSS